MMMEVKRWRRILSCRCNSINWPTTMCCHWRLKTRTDWRAQKIPKNKRINNNKLFSFLFFWRRRILFYLFWKSECVVKEMKKNEQRAPIGTHAHNWVREKEGARKETGASNSSDLWCNTDGPKETMAPLLLHTHPQTDTRTGYTQAVAAYKEERKGGKGAGLSLSTLPLYCLLLFFSFAIYLLPKLLDSIQRNVTINSSSFCVIIQF